MIKNYWPFLKTGFLALGGGIGMIPYLEEIARDQAGVDQEGFLQIMVLAQTFPGAMGINGAAIIGYRLDGWKGALLAVIGVTIPGVLFATALFYVAGSLYHALWFKDVLQALKAAVVGIVLGMVVNLGRTGWVNWRQIAVGILAVLVFYYLKVNPVFILMGAGLLGYFFLRSEET